MENNKLNNPFIVSRNIPEAYFCDRTEETDFLIKQIKNGRNTVLVSPRRMGKTGLIHHIFRQTDIAEHYQTFFIDIYAASSLQEMCYMMGKNIFERLKSKKTQHWEHFFQVIKSLRAGFSFDTLTGEPKFEMGIGTIENPDTTLEEIFTYLESSPQPCIVAIDEFQQISDFQEKRVEASLRSMVQRCTQTSFIFSGSKQHTISQMFHSKTRPFYQSAQLMELHPIDMAVYADFAINLFAQYDKQVDRNVVEQVYANYNGTTWYMQMMMNELFALTEIRGHCTSEYINRAEKNIIETQGGLYQSQLSILSVKQKQLLQAIARERNVKGITSAAFLKKYALDSASSIQSALKGLTEKEVISSNDTGYYVIDYFFGDWLRENY